MHRTGRARAGPLVPATASAPRSPATPTSSARWTPTCRTIRGFCRRSSPRPTRGAGLIIGSRYLDGRPRRELAAAAHDAQRIRQQLHPHGHRPARARLHQRLSLLAARGAGPDSARLASLGRLLVSRRGDVSGGGRRHLRIARSADRVRRAPAGRSKLSARCCVESLVTPWRLASRTGAVRDRVQIRRDGRHDGPSTEFYRGRRVMITGGLGFIGSNLAHRLAELGADILLVDSLIPDYGGNLFNIAGIEDRVRVNVADVRQASTMNYLVRDREIIFNLAGQVSHIDSMRDPAHRSRDQLPQPADAARGVPRGTIRDAKVDLREHAADLRPARVPAGHRAASGAADRRQRHQQGGRRVLPSRLQQRLRRARHARCG